MYTSLSATRSYIYSVARACDNGHVSRRVSLPQLYIAFRSSTIDFLLKDCAGAILYASDNAVQVALEAMQCLGGNGYINGTQSITSWLLSTSSGVEAECALVCRLSYWSDSSRFEVVHRRCGNTGDTQDVDWEGVQPRLSAVMTHECGGAIWTWIGI